MAEGATKIASRDAANIKSLTWQRNRFSKNVLLYVKNVSCVTLDELSVPDNVYGLSIGGASSVCELNRRVSRLERLL